jgi:hypothetical protein
MYIEFRSTGSELAEVGDSGVKEAGDLGVLSSRSEPVDGPGSVEETMPWSSMSEPCRGGRKKAFLVGDLLCVDFRKVDVWIFSRRGLFGDTEGFRSTSAASGLLVAAELDGDDDDGDGADDDEEATTASAAAAAACHSEL